MLHIASFVPRMVFKFGILATIFSVTNVAYAQSSLFDSTGRRKIKSEKDGEPLDKLYPFKVSNAFYLSGVLSVPLRTHTGTAGFGATVGVVRGLLDLNITYINESRVWRQLEQRSNEEVLKDHRAAVVGDEWDPIKASRYTTQFLWSESDPFELWSLDFGFGVRYPSAFLPPAFTNHLMTFVSLGTVKDKSVTSINYSTRGVGLLGGLNWRIPGYNNFEAKASVRYSILEASENSFTDILGQISLQEFSILTGVDYFL